MRPVDTTESERYAVDLTIDGAHAVEQVSGEVDLLAADPLRDEGTAALDRPDVDALIVDVSGVTFLDAAGLNGLVALRTRADALGKRFTLRGVTAGIARLLAITELAAMFGVEPA